MSLRENATDDKAPVALNSLSIQYIRNADLAMQELQDCALKSATF